MNLKMVVCMLEDLEMAICLMKAAVNAKQMRKALMMMKKFVVPMTNHSGDGELKELGCSCQSADGNSHKDALVDAVHSVLV